MCLVRMCSVEEHWIMGTKMFSDIIEYTPKSENFDFFLPS